MPPPRLARDLIWHDRRHPRSFRTDASDGYSGDQHATPSPPVFDLNDGGSRNPSGVRPLKEVQPCKRISSNTTGSFISGPSPRPFTLHAGIAIVEEPVHVGSQATSEDESIEVIQTGYAVLNNPEQSAVSVIVRDTSSHRYPSNTSSQDYISLTRAIDRVLTLDARPTTDVRSHYASQNRFVHTSAGASTLSSSEIHDTTKIVPSELKTRPKRNQRDRNLRVAMRDQELRSRYPPFEIDRPDYPEHHIVLCPSKNHPISDLPRLINQVKRDGIPLESLPDQKNIQRVAVAFDMEWAVSRTRGIENQTAVVQIAGRSQTLIIQLSMLSPFARKGPIPESLRAFLRDPSVIKLGVGIRNDGTKLLRDHPTGPKHYLNSYLELSPLVKTLMDHLYPQPDKVLLSLQQVVADVLHLYLCKGSVRMSNWNKTLDDEQLLYAASDVIATVRVFDRLMSMPKAGLDPTLSSYISSFEPHKDLQGLIDDMEHDHRSYKQTGIAIRRPITIAPLMTTTSSNSTLDKWITNQNQQSTVSRTTPHWAQSEVNLSPRIKQAWELWSVPSSTSTSN